MNRQFDENIKAFVAKSSIPQLAVGVWHNGESYYANYGHESQACVDVFEIGSVGKTFTATLLAVLVDKGLVSLNDNVNKFKPELPFAKDVTLLQLATHTSGLPSDPFTGFVLHAKKAVQNFSHSDYCNFLNGLNKPLKSGKFNYSNIGMALLGNLLADHVGSTYEEAVKTYILDPLGMSDTHVSNTVYDEHRLAIGHGGDGKAVAHFKWDSMEPAGLWRSTTKDMIVFLKAHLGYSGEQWKNLLAKTTVAAINDPKCDHVGLAWMLACGDVVGDYAWHNGQTLGQKSMAVCCPNQDTAIVMLSNKAPRLWHNFFSSYSIEQLSFEMLKELIGGKEHEEKA
ncbi:serine hydrolase domain-containing protein [Alishewanella jeotgali]|uniref:Beta-lactamase n=1 Tax=Alishewanella jeotgali KCTC 22429 TaxID=1129374 RepID=H3ZFP3_9ALTE|nr:serine hydrolase domain-containing protein [Alishewanella jeotgali]EHR40527.1 beta-lactamase [Alishewanella jeotgali KCTC 22429]